MKFSSFVFSASMLACLSSTTVLAQGNTCEGNDWCVEFKSLASSLDGTSNTNDITATFDASASTNYVEKYYKVTLLDHANCNTPVPVTSGVAVVSDNDGNNPVASLVADNSDSSGKSATLSVAMDIDTTQIENTLASGTGLATVDDTNSNQFKVEFCVKVDLFSKADSTSPAYEVATSKTKIALSVDMEKGFDFAVSAAAVTADTVDPVTVAVNYPLLQCVCAVGADDPVYDATTGVATCLDGASAYDSLIPGSPFKFCIQAVDQYDPASNPPLLPAAVSAEVAVMTIKSAAFENTIDTSLNIPIVATDSTSGVSNGIGPAAVYCGSSASTAPYSSTNPPNGVCVVSAVTYARMYEADTNSDSILENISGGNKVVGTSVLEFIAGGSSSGGSSGSSAVTSVMAPSGTCSYDAGSETISGTCTGAEVKDLCAANSNMNCCVGDASTCGWPAMPVSISKNTCLGNHVCKFVSGLASFTVGEGSCHGEDQPNCYDESAGPEAVVTIGENSCNLQKSCRWQSYPGKPIVEITIGNGSCNGDDSIACGVESANGEGNVIMRVGHRSCNGFSPCAFRVNNFIVGDDSCVGRLACASHHTVPMPALEVGTNACIGEAACHYKQSSIGDNSCIGSSACYADSAMYANSGSVGVGSCIGDSACSRKESTVGDGSCLAANICQANTNPVGDNEFAARRLGSSTVNGSISSDGISKSHPAPRKLVELGFSSSTAASRQLQTNDATPVDEFALEVNLATPPDHSASAAVSLFTFTTFLSLIMAGLVGLVNI